MLKMTASVCIDASAPAVWRFLSDLARISDWVEAIQHAHCPGASRGVGALRICQLKQGTIHETIIDWEEGRSFRYRGVGAPMMKSATNRWTVEARGNQTLVTTYAEVVLKGGVFGRLLEPMVRTVSTRLGRRSLASLKYLVEQGSPFPGRARDLPVAAAVC